MIKTKSSVVRHRFVNNQGHIAIRILASTVTLLLIGGAIYYLLYFQQQAHQRDVRKALEVSEYGLFHALQKLQADPHYTQAIVPTKYNGGSYSVDFALKNSGDTTELIITAVGVYRSVTQQKECVLAQDITGGDTTWINKSIQ